MRTSIKGVCSELGNSAIHHIAAQLHSTRGFQFMAVFRLERPSDVNCCSCLPELLGVGGTLEGKFELIS